MIALIKLQISKLLVFVNGDILWGQNYLHFGLNIGLVFYPERNSKYSYGTP